MSYNGLPVTKMKLNKLLSCMTSVFLQFLIPNVFYLKIPIHITKLLDLNGAQKIIKFFLKFVFKIRLYVVKCLRELRFIKPFTIESVFPCA